VAAVHTALLQPPFDLVAARKNMKNVDWSVAEVQELADGRAQIIAPDYLRSGGNKVLVKGSLASVEAAHQYIKEKRVAALY
jgi:hypothetical protein